MSSEPPDDRILTALRARRSRVRRVRYRENRTVLFSLSRDGTTLNSHVCFRDAPPPIVEAVAVAVTESAPGPRRKALEVLREWQGTREGLERARRRKPRRGRAVNGPETEGLRELFRRLNDEAFSGELPEIPLRVSRRMTRSLGTIRFGEGSQGARLRGPAGADRSEEGRAASNGGSVVGRTVVEIAISAALLHPSNRAVLVDTMLHEMAHAEAWLEHGHRGHGEVWRAVARRVGCHPRAVNDVRVARRNHRGRRSYG